MRWAGSIGGICEGLDWAGGSGFGRKYIRNYPGSASEKIGNGICIQDSLLHNFSSRLNSSSPVSLVTRKKSSKSSSLISDQLPAKAKIALRFSSFLYPFRDKLEKKKADARELDELIELFFNSPEVGKG